MGSKILELHDWKNVKPDDSNERIASFLFTLRTAEERASGKKPGGSNAFWTDVRLSRDLAARGRWAGLSDADKLKAMFCFAEERIQETGKKIREAPMFWHAMSPLKDGPPWDLSKVKFPKPPAAVFEAPAENDALLATRKAAQLG